MKAIQVKTFGGPEQLEYVDIPVPEPGPGEIVIAAKAIGVNPVDTYIRAGVYPALPRLPYTPGKDVAGVIHALGQGEHNFGVGDRVYSSGTLTGAYAPFVLCSAEQVFALPDNMSYQQGAAVGVPGSTAWRGLFIRGGAQSGEKVLIHGASGSVGLAATQLAQAAGLEVHGTAGTSQGLEVVKEAGARFVYDHCDPGYMAKVEGNSRGGVHLILEMLANKNLENDLSLLAPRGRVVVIGSRGRIEIDPRATMAKETEIRGLALFNCTRREMVTAQRALFEAMAEGSYCPRIHGTFPLSMASHAHERVLESGNCGKVLLLP